MEPGRSDIAPGGVATHTAGLTTFNPTYRLPTEEAIRRYGVLFWPPGERFDYSNLGPIVLQEIIARVSRKDYADFLASEVLGPLSASGGRPEMYAAVAGLFLG